MSGCGNSPPPQTDPALRGIDFRARTTLEARAQVATTVTVRNRRATPVVIAFPMTCFGLLRAYDQSDRRVPVWEQEAGSECPETQTRLSLMPDEARDVEIPAAGVSDVLGMDLPDGTYRFTVVIEPDGQVLEIEAGEATLARR